MGDNAAGLESHLGQPGSAGQCRRMGRSQREQSGFQEKGERDRSGCGEERRRGVGA